MSYVVKGYEFPQSCRECWLRDYEGCHDCSCIFTGNYWELEEDIPSKSRLPKCPLVEIPTPHGRLIDADELSKAFDWKQLENSPDEKGQMLYLLGQTTIEAIREVPTIIEVEESE